MVGGPQAYLTGLAKCDEAGSLAAVPWGEAAQRRALWSAAAASMQSPRGPGVRAYLAPRALAVYLGVALRDASDAELTLVLHNLFSRQGPIPALGPQKSHVSASLGRSLSEVSLKFCVWAGRGERGNTHGV